MLKQIKKHYMPILTVLIFISVFFYQFFCLTRIPVIEQYSLKDIDYVRLLVYVLIVVLITILVYNITLFLSIEISISFELNYIRFTTTYKKVVRSYSSKNLVSKKYKTFSVYRC